MRIHLAIILGALLLARTAAAEPPLVVEPLSGEAPLLVRIAGPRMVLDRIAKCRFGYFDWIGPGGNGLSIDWGDGSETFSFKEMFSAQPEEEGCAERQRRHVYAVPGTYRLKAQISHPGPTDGPVTDWQGEAVINVGGEGPPDSLAIVEPHDTQSFPYQRFPNVRWRASVREPSTIRVEVISEDGASLGTKDFDWASAGERDVNPIIPLESFDAALRRGEASAFLRVSLIWDGKVLISRDSLPQGISARIQDNQYFVLVRGDLADSFTALVKVNLPLNDGDSVRIEWGDGTITAYSGRHDVGESTFAHTYSQPGDYSIRLRTDAYSGDLAVDEVVGYYELDVRVPAVRVDRFPDAKR